MLRPGISMLLIGLPLALAPSASAAMLTLGSTLDGQASLIESRGADTAFWLHELEGRGIEVPEDGQVMKIRVKGTALRERGAPNDPATMVHFQTLGPAAANGARVGYLSSAAFYMPVDEPNTVTTFEPENLCIQQGGTVAFNTIGGFRWGGALDAPLSNSYINGTPWQIFAGSGASTAWYTKDAGTNNGDTLTPSGGTNAGDGQGGILQGRELLMQIVVATGDDRAQPCGGPRRHPDGSLVDTGPAPSYMKVTTAGGKPQRPYVTKDRRFRVGVYCGGEANDACTGTATMLLGTRRIARSAFSIPKLSSGRIAMRLPRYAFRRLDRSRTRTLRVTFVMTTPFGTYTSKLTLKR